LDERSHSDDLLTRVEGELRAVGASLLVEAPGRPPVVLGDTPARARVCLRNQAARRALAARDHLALAEAYLRGDVDVEGDLLEVVKVVERIGLEAGWWERAKLGLQLLFRDRIRYDRESIAFHYDRPAGFFLPWLGRWRCYSHGLYQRAGDPLDESMERKMRRAVESLGLEAGMDVLDMGAGWGCFLEYAGRLGIRVHGITISEAQYAFCQELIREQGLPCTIELVNFREYVPRLRFDAAVFMGTLEHNPEYDLVARFLLRVLQPSGRLWADFCAQRTDFTIGRFMKKYIWPGPITYVNPYRLVRELVRVGFNVHALVDDTRSYACTVRDWGDGLELHRKALAERFGEPEVRAFLLFLRGSQLFLERNRTQAYHVVAGLEPAPFCEEEAARVSSDSVGTPGKVW
jgi:cyclopropane-fatty-acyl-phospholipid synthase